MRASPSAFAQKSATDHTPRPTWACVEVAIACALIAGQRRLPGALFMFGLSPWLTAIGLLFLWFRRPAARGFGFNLPPSLGRALVIGAVVGVAYQFVGTWIVEPAIARLTTGELPDASSLRSVVGNSSKLAMWTVQIWLLIATFEEFAFRGWILMRLAEIGRFSDRAWIVAAMLSSVLFGLIHAYQGLSGIIATGLSGLVFAAVYLATGRNLWGAVVAHGVLDTTAFVLIYFGVYPGV